MIADEQRVTDVLRCAGARFGLVHGSRVHGTPRPDSDLDVGAWWGDRPPASWEVDLPTGVDLVVLDTAPLWLSGRIAQQGRLLFDDDPQVRVRWQADTRLRYLDEIPAIRERYRAAGSSWPAGRRVVDQERLDRLLDRAASDVKVLVGCSTAAGDLLDDPIQLAAVKYYFITAIEGCARIAHHLVASEGWRVAESNADAVRTLGAQRVVAAATAEAVARAVGFRTVLVHEYVDVDDGRVRDNLQHLADLEAFVSQVAAWAVGQNSGD